MPLFHDIAPTFSQKFPEAANIFDNLHMLHDNIDDVLSSPEMFLTIEAKRARIYQILEIYLHRNQQAEDQRYAHYRLPADRGHHHGVLGGSASSLIPQPPVISEPATQGASEGHHH
jgi:hypothetical protein